LAREGVQNGEIWGFLAFSAMYSDYYRIRTISGGRLVDSDTLEGLIIAFFYDKCSYEYFSPQAWKYELYSF
jgi:hypothetical protein